MNDENRPSTAQLIEDAKAEALRRVRADRDRARGDFEVEEILERIEARLFHPDFDVNELRREHAPTQQTLRRFRVLCGGPLKAYVNERRLDAARLLVEHGVPESSIAEGLGFGGPLPFARWFKRWTGQTPTVHRAASAIESPEPLEAWPTLAVWFRARAGVLRCQESARLVALLRATAVRAGRPR